MTDRITVEHCQNPRVRVFLVTDERILSEYLIVAFHREYARYDTGASRFKQIGRKGERIVKGIFDKSSHVQKLFIHPKKLTIEVDDEKYWDEVESQVQEVIFDVIYRTFQSY